MWDVRVPALILAAGLTLGSPLNAQAPPDISLPPGDAARGKTIFEGTKGNCQNCHRINGVGSLFGPDLSAIGAPRGGGGGGGGGARGGNAPAPVPPTPAPAVAAGPPAAAPATPPPAPEAARGGGGNRGGQGGGQATPTPQQLAQSILDPNATVSVQNRYVVLKMKDGKTITGKLLSLDTFAVQIFDSTEKLASISRDNVREMTMTSPMPSYREKLTTQELSDVISYLLSLKGQ